MAEGIRLQSKLASYVIALRAISNPYRLAVVYLLAHGSLRTRDLMQKIGIKQSLLVHHLNVLEQHGWVKKHRVGKHMAYSLEKKMFKKLARLAKDTPFWSPQPASPKL